MLTHRVFFGPVLFVAALLLAACSGGPTPSAGPLFVNPTSGSDTAKGTQAEPLKTIGRALTLVKANGEVFLQAGTYRDGEVWPLVVPSGVTIGAVVANSALLVSPTAGSGTALSFAAGGKAQDLVIRDFEIGATASVGQVELVGMTFDNLRLQGVVATGTSQVQVRSSSFQNPATAYAGLVQDSASLTAIGGSVTGGSGFSLEDQAKLDASGMTVTGTNYTLSAYQGGLEATLTNMTITGTLRSAVYLRDTATNVWLTSVTIDGAGELGVSAYEYLGELHMLGGSVSGASSGRPAVLIAGNDTTHVGGTLFMNGTQITHNLGFGVQVSDFGTADIRGANISSNNSDGVDLFEPAHLIMRGTTVIANGGAGIYLRGHGATPDPSSADLGTSAEQGQNTIKGNGLPNLRIVDSSMSAVLAAGNVWDASVQGTSATGTMVLGAKITGPVTGANFYSDVTNEIWF